jgi:hypothetical protein
MYDRGAALDECYGKHQRRSENEASHRRGRLRRHQEIDAKSEQSPLGQQATAAIGLVPVADEAEHLP